MRYLLLILTITFSSTCIAQKFSDLIKKAQVFKESDNFSEALLTLDEAWKIAGTDKHKQIEVLYYTAENYYNLEKYDSADSLCLRAITACELQENRKQNIFYVRIICLIASTQIELSNYDKALLFTDKAIEHSELDSYDYALSMGMKGIVLSEQGNKREAIEFFKRSYAVIQNIHFMNDNLFYIQITYAKILQHLGSFKLSKQILEKVTPEIMAKKGGNSIFLESTYNLLGIFYSQTGSFLESVYYLKKSNQISKNRNDFNGYLRGLYNITTNYLLNHIDLDSTILYKNLFKENIKEVKGINLSQICAMRDHNLDILFYHEIGDYNNGIKSCQKKIEYIEKHNLQEKYIDEYVDALGNMGSNYLEIHNYEEAIFYYEKALKALIQVSHKSSEAVICMNLSISYSANKQYDKSFIFREKCLILSEQIYGKESSTYIYDLEDKGVDLIRLKRFKEALPLIKNGIIEARKNLGEYNRRTITYTSNLLSTYRLLHQKDSITILSKNLSNALSGIYQKSLPNLNQRNRINFIKKYEKNTQMLFSAALDLPTTPELTSIAYDHTLLTKGIVQTYTQIWKQQLEKTTDKKLKTLYDSWLENKLLISKQYEIEIAARLPNLDSIITLTENMESQLSQKSASFRLANEQVNWQQVQSKLKDGEASVEFIHFQYHNGFELTDSIMYAALVLKKGDVAPTLVPLFEEKALNELLKANIVYKKDDKSDLYRLIWQPLEKYLGDAQHIYYAPSGKLELVSFDALCYERGHFLNDKYSVFRRLRSTRTLFFGLDDTPLRVTKNTRNLLLGDVKYGINDEVKEGDVAKMEAKNCTFKHLPNAARQYNLIDSLTRFYKLKNLNQRQYEANEAYFKRIVAENNESPEIIQFFTHGFYQEKPTFSERCALLAIKDPLYRSGVALANSNVAWCEGKNTKDKEDGLLTAAEISTMDLSNTKVVILTACQSGLGDLQGSEGIQGLQSAFKMANAKTQLVALWNLDSFCAEKFSSLFYDKILRGASPYEAFRATQAAVIKSDKYGVNVWGAFVLVE